MNYKEIVLLFNQFRFVFYRLMHIHYKAILISLYLYPSKLRNKGNLGPTSLTSKQIRFYKRNKDLVFVLFMERES